MLQIKSEIEEFCKSRQISNEITHKACLNFVSALSWNAPERRNKTSVVVARN